jgi:hypothetical protein
MPIAIGFFKGLLCYILLSNLVTVNYKNAMGLKILYTKYQKLDQNYLFSIYYFFCRLPRSAKNFRLEIQNLIEESIVRKDKAQLQFALNMAYKDGIDNSYTTLIAKLLIANWHDEHEGLVNTIYLENLNDDVYTDSLYKIATEPDPYRKYDDEMESTLRKCIHALKMINSIKANAYLEKLQSTKNSNIDMVLSMYDK